VIVLELKERIGSLTNLINELEEKKKAAHHEMLDAVEFAEPEELTPEFIDWYYWDTGLSLNPLAAGLGCSTSVINKMVTPNRKLEIPCAICVHKKLIFSVKTRNERSSIIDKQKTTKKMAGRLLYLEFVKSEYICEDCKQDFRRQEELKIQKKLQKQKANKAKKIEKLVEMPYEEYLLTPYWKKFAHNARKLAGYRCEKCHRGNRVLHVHHLTYERRGHELLADVKVLCYQCHAAIHGRVVE